MQNGGGKFLEWIRYGMGVYRGRCCQAVGFLPVIEVRSLPGHPPNPLTEAQVLRVAT
jgi:hypothetical protein